jgi:hypothetical protein
VPVPVILKNAPQKAPQASGNIKKGGESFSQTFLSGFKVFIFFAKNK